ncbi:DNA-binding protein [Enterococcus casseliflavus]|uniref:DNA-binding protein n=1 Tax=Enterococcus casseliflavus TaxID=37734 RepID=UPI002952CAAB|nr:DNA-binding protein [Enterococcus casseliflavus]MDV7751194.1 DNA-binding protein [Enterococcus casseliflavus]
MELRIDSIDMQDKAMEPIINIIAQAVDQSFKTYQTRVELPRYMSKKQACQYLDCSFVTLQNFIKNGLKVIMIDKTVKIDQQDCDTFMQQNKK